MQLPKNKTKIVCTIGPASQSPEIITRLLEAGMNIARLNFSHGDFETHKKVIENLRGAAATTGCRVAIMADLPGPKVRVGEIAREPVQLRPGDHFVLTTANVAGDARRVSVSFPRLPEVVKPGDALFLNDGYIQLEVTGVEGGEVLCIVRGGGELRSRKGVNLPAIDLGVSAFTDRDHECLSFALENGVDAVSQSFVEKAEDVETVRRAAAAMGHHPFIIAKIERRRALEKSEEIIAAADGIMIARGDLGVEVPIEEIAVVQKRLIRMANRHAKPVITATQMLESMTGNRRPTRAEATDVANAILDGTDGVMLSGESAMGKYPVEAVEMLARIAASVELHRRTMTVKESYRGTDLRGVARPERLISKAVEACIEFETPAAVFVPTRSGATARSVARFRFPVWTVAVSPRESTCRHLVFSSGVLPVLEEEDLEQWTDYVKAWVRDRELCGKVAILVEGPSAKHPAANHRMEIILLEEKDRPSGETA